MNDRDAVIARYSELARTAGCFVRLSGWAASRRSSGASPTSTPSAWPPSGWELASRAT